MNRHLTMILALISFMFLAGPGAFASNNTSKRTDSADTSDSALKVGSDGPEAMVKAAVPSSPEQPEKLDGYGLASYCRADMEGFDAGYCLGVVEGAIASMRLCKRDSSVITLGEAADAVEQYLVSHPQKLDKRDVALARKALSKAFPCGGVRR
jgi:hypothetical protein